MTRRERLARWICPALAKDAARGRHITSEIAHTRRWLAADFPEVEIVLERIVIATANYFRPLDQKSITHKCAETGVPWSWGMNEFRDQMLRRFFRSRLVHPFRQGRPKQRPDGMPSRIDQSMMTPAELAITAAMAEVEKAGSSNALTDAVILLTKARERVADHAES